MQANENDILPYLPTFGKAAELGSFTEAARALGVTQGAVSQRIQTLESCLGTSLFRRVGRRVLPTAAGRKLFEYAEKILALSRDARLAVAGRRERPVSELRLAASSIPGEHLMPEILAEFRRGHPDVRVRMDGGDSSAVIAKVQRGQVSLGVVGDRSQSTHLEFRPFARDRIVAAVPADDPWRRRKVVPLALLRGRPLVVREVGSGLRHAFESALSEAGGSLAEFPEVAELGSNEAVKQAVLRRMGVGVLSTLAVQADVAAGRLHTVEIRGLRSDRDLFLVLDTRRVLSAAARLFLQFLASRIGTNHQQT